MNFIDFILILLTYSNENMVQLENVIGYLRHTCKIYLLGNKLIRGTKRQKYGLTMDVDDPNTYVTKFTKFSLSKESIFDLYIWLSIYSEAKYRLLDIDRLLKPKSLPTIKVWTDASTSYGCGGYSESGDLFHLLELIEIFISQINSMTDLNMY